MKTPKGTLQSCMRDCYDPEATVYDYIVERWDGHRWTWPDWAAEGKPYLVGPFMRKREADKAIAQEQERH